MIRVLAFLAAVFALGLGFAWLADRPGDMVVTFDGYQYRVTLMVAAVALTAIVAGVMILWWFLKAIWNSPYLVSRYFRVRRRDRGYQALSTGMIAAGAGDAALARKMNQQAAKLIRSDQEPLVHLLDAQATLLEGDHDGARRKFEAMLDDPETRLLGLRGLYLEAERLGDRTAARHYAARAADTAPQLAWASEATMEDKIAQGDWEGALRLLEAQKIAQPADKSGYARRRAVLLTAKADALFDTDPTSARAAATEANRLQPDFVPAALVAARAAFRNNDTRKGAKILETAWKANPHPEVADLYVHARHGDAVNDRLTRARRLRAIKQNHAESALAVARAALDAGDHRLAREQAESALRLDPREGTWLLLADIEEADTGDVGRVRELLGRAVRAPRDPAWVADGIEAEHWAPVSPVTGRLDAFEWRSSVARLGPVIEQEPDIPPPGQRLVPAPPLPSPDTDDAPAGDVDLAVAVAEPEPSSDATVAPEREREPANDSHPAGIVPLPVDDKADAERPKVESENLAAVTMDGVMPHPPDDPGVDPADAGAPKRFRLF